MTAERIRKRLSGGFRPFTLRTSDGHEYAVRHPEWILLGPRTLGVLDSDGEIVTLDLFHIVGLKDLPRRRS
jgi:hypothetical protein